MATLAPACAEVASKSAEAVGMEVPQVSDATLQEADDEEDLNDDASLNGEHEEGDGLVEEGEDQEVSRKSKKRKAKEEAKAEWKAAQKAKKKGKRGGSRRKYPLGDVRGEAKEGCAEDEVGVATGPRPPISPEEVKQLRIARKAAELEDFKTRSNKGTIVVLDLEWEDDMQSRELKSLFQQVLYCYGANRRATHPVRLALSGIRPGSETDIGLRKQSGFDTWPVQIIEGAYVDAFPREKLVYLTADSEEVLESFDADKVYIIGGIVDRNRLKGATMQKAVEQDIATAQLPLGAHIEMGSYSRVLAVNHVLSMILDHQATGDWRGVCERCVPGRKTLIDPAAPLAAASGELSQGEPSPGEAVAADDKPPIEIKEDQAELAIAS